MLVQHHRYVRIRNVKSDRSDFEKTADGHLRTKPTLAASASENFVHVGVHLGIVQPTQSKRGRRCWLRSAVLCIFITVFRDMVVQKGISQEEEEEHEKRKAMILERSPSIRRRQIVAQIDVS